MRRLLVSQTLLALLTVGGSVTRAPLQQSAAKTDYHSQPSLTSAPKADISGTWIAHMKGPMGEMEIVYRLRVSADGKISGSQELPFGESPIVDGVIAGDDFHFTVELDSFGKLQKREVTGKIERDSLVLTPALPGPPPDLNGPGGPDAASPAGPPPAFSSGPIVAKRGTPALNFRASAVDYAHLPSVTLPVLHAIPANGLAQTPPMGWNSWNKFHTHIDDATVRAIADAIVQTGMKDAGYTYVIIDDGWQGIRDAHGALAPNANFPDMKALAEYVHAKGLKIGIYSSPGPRTCGGFEGSYGHEEQDAKMFADWGMDYLKYDWCSASRVWKDQEMQAVYQKMGDALAQTGRPIVYALCQYGRADVQRWATQVSANLWRTTGDIRDQYSSMTSIGFSQSRLADFAGPGHWNDPDMLEVGNGGMSDDEYKTHFSLWAMIAAPLIAGNDARSMSAETSNILLNKDIIAIDQDPLGSGGKEIINSGGIHIWKKPLAGGDVAIAIFNRGDREVRAVVPWQSLAIEGKYTVRDLWAHADLGQTGAVNSMIIPAHGTAMFRLTKQP